jgi:hypothetical protein
LDDVLMDHGCDECNRILFVILILLLLLFLILIVILILIPLRIRGTSDRSPHFFGIRTIDSPYPQRFQRQDAAAT